jgi:hypothetical protein
MTVHEEQLEQLGTALRAAVARDIRVRARRRRRVLRWSLVPVVGLSLTGAAFAISPLWGEPAPPKVQSAFDQQQAQTMQLPANVALPAIPAGTKLTLWAADGDQRVYGTRVGDESCLLYVLKDTPTVGTCRDQTPAPDGIRFDLVGGATTHEGNLVSGQVTDPRATSVSIALPGGQPPIEVPVGFEGWFVAQLPDTTLGTTAPSSRPVGVTVTARDAKGTVVAQASTDGH